MRLRKVKNAKERLTDGYYFIENSKDNKGNWHKVFNNDNTSIIENANKVIEERTLDKIGKQLNEVYIKVYNS